MDNEDCVTGEDSITCPATSMFNFGGAGSVILSADMSCPLDIVGETSFTRASQAGQCSCERTTLTIGTGEEKDIICDCFACPEGSRLNFAYQCDTAIVNRCFSYNCDFECNGDISVPTDDPLPTPPPTPDHECTVKGDIISCPTSVDFENNSDEATLHTNIMCPLDAIDSSGEVDFEDCACKDSKLEVFGVESPINCNCFACPEGSLLEFATVCDSPIVSDCMSFNCNYECNGPLGGPTPPPIDFTFSPTSSPIPSSAPGMAVSSPFLWVAVIGFTLLGR